MTTHCQWVENHVLSPFVKPDDPVLVAPAVVVSVEVPVGADDDDEVVVEAHRLTNHF